MTASSAKPSSAEAENGNSNATQSGNDIVTSNAAGSNSGASSSSNLQAQNSPVSSNADNGSAQTSGKSNQPSAESSTNGSASIPASNAGASNVGNDIIATNAQAAANSSSGQNAGNAAAMSLKEVKQRFSADVFYSPEITSRTMDNLITSGSATTATDKFNFSFNTGALFRFDLNDHWSVSLGATYSTISYSTSVKSSYVVPASDTAGGPQNNGGFHIHGGHGGPGGGGNDNDSSHQFNDPNYFNHYFPPSNNNNNVQYNNDCGNFNLHGDPYGYSAASFKQSPR